MGEWGDGGMGGWGVGMVPFGQFLIVNCQLLIVNESPGKHSEQANFGGWPSVTKIWYNIKKIETGKHFLFFLRL